MVENKETAGLIEDIRVESEEILRNATDLVEINMASVDEVLIPRIRTYLAIKKENSWLPEGHEFPLEKEAGLNLFIDVINFCYKDPATGNEYRFTDRGVKVIKRATGLMAAMARSGVDWNSFSSVSKISMNKWEEMLQLSDSNQMFLSEERREKIVGFAKYLLAQNYENMPNLLIDCGYDVLTILDLLNESGYFEDKFMKRSQLACRMINDVLVRRDCDPLLNVDKLTVMADYRIPQVFYNLGVVDLIDKSLVDSLVKGSPILANSKEEMALRATAIVVGKMVADKLDICEADADGILWGLAQDMAKNGEMTVPHMIVATDAY